MNNKEAASRKHHLVDGPARLNSRHCGNDHIAAVGKKQQEFEKNKIVNNCDFNYCLNLPINPPLSVDNGASSFLRAP